RGAGRDPCPGRHRPGHRRRPGRADRRLEAGVRATRAEVDLGAIAHNVSVLAEHVAPAGLCAVVKADGYGHGAISVGRAALAAGATWLAVALVEEAAVLRRNGVEAPILLLSEPRTS